VRKLLGKASSINVRKVAWTCAELGLAFTREDWGSGFRPTEDPAFLALNPNAMVPVLIDGDFVLWESNSIIRYLANQHGAWLYPSSPRLRARIDQWIDWQATDLNRSWTYAFMGAVRQSADHQDQALIADSWTQWTRNMTILEGQLANTGAFVAGDDFSLADIPVGLSVHRWMATPLPHADLPAVSAYYEQMNNREGFRLYGKNGTP